MKTISIIIPFYQKEPGILTRALRSVVAQQIPPEWSVEILVVDDGSPVPAENEITGLIFAAPFHLRVIRQKNGGVAVARNRGLNEMTADTILIAFLDSDDIWPESHLSEAIIAHESGNDFSFCDNFRDGHHTAYCAKCAPKTQSWILKGRNENGFIDLPLKEMPSLIIEEFPTQASTVVFNYDLARGLFFNTDLKSAGEDMLFFVALAVKSQKICYNSHSKVECGGGINIFFGNFSWDSPDYLRIKQDRVRCHTIINFMPGLSESTRRLNKKLLNKLRCDFIFHSIRQLLKQGRLPGPVSTMIKTDAAFWHWAPLSMLRILVSYPLGYYRP